MQCLHISMIALHRRLYRFWHEVPPMCCLYDTNERTVLCFCLKIKNIIKINNIDIIKYLYTYKGTRLFYFWMNGDAKMWSRAIQSKRDYIMGYWERVTVWIKKGNDYPDIINFIVRKAVLCCTTGCFVWTGCWMCI